MFSYLAVHIYKNYDVRLVDGVKGSFEGRVEVYRVGYWGTICDDEWGLSDANVVCKQLGYASAKTVHGKSYFGEGTGRIWLDDLACIGNETNIGQCLHRGWGSHDCTHKQDAGVVCDKGKADAFQHFIIVIRELTQPRQRQRQREKTFVFMSKQQLCTCIMLFRPLHQFVSFLLFRWRQCN